MYLHRKKIHTSLLVIAIGIGVFIAAMTAFLAGPTFTLFSTSGETFDESYAVRMTDLNNDGSLDYLVHYFTGFGSHQIDTYINNGAGVYTHTNAAISFGLAAATVMDVGDVNNDGYTDVAVIDVGDLKIYKNNGAGAFTLHNTVSVNTTGTRFADVNNDGKLDVVTYNNAGATSQAVLLNDGNGNFMKVSSTLRQASEAAVADMNGDGSLDLVLTDGNASYVYINSGTGAFVQSFTNSVGATTTSPIVGDFNHDGKIDYAVSNGSAFYVYLNNGLGTAFGSANYTTGGTLNAMETGDIDNDGDQDIITAINGGSERWLNTGLGVFTLDSSAAEVSDNTFRLAIGDIDNDGDLDYVTGVSANIGNRRYKSNQSTLLVNTDPSPPSANFNATKTNSGAKINMTLLWGSGSDTETSTNMLQYVIRVGTGSTGKNIVSPAAASPTYVRRVIPNIKSRQILINNISCNQTYYWSVAAVDAQLKQGAFSSEQITTVDGSCNISNVGGGGGGGSSGGTGGGDLSRVKYKYPNTLGLPPVPKVPVATITGSVFFAFSQTAKQTGIANVKVTFTAKNSNGQPYMITGVTAKDGRFSVDVPPTALSGAYKVSIDLASPPLAGMRPIASHDYTVIVKADHTSGVPNTLFTYSNLLNYDPCLAIDQTLSSESTDDARAVYDLLRISGAKPIVPASVLITREKFFNLLAATQCITLPSTEALKEKFRGSHEKAFIDLPLTGSETSRLFYTLMLQGVPVSKTVAKGKLIDPTAYITSADAMAAIRAILPKGADLTELGILPVKDKPSSALLTSVALRSIILASFSNGKIHLEADPRAAVVTDAKDTFSTTLAALPVPSCLTAGKRSFVLDDVDPFDSLVPKLLSVKTADGQWLLSPVTSDDGIELGKATLEPNAKVSLLSFLRTTLLLSCLAPQTAAQKIQQQGLQSSFGFTFGIGGTKASLTGPDVDTIFGFARTDVSFPARAAIQLQKQGNDGLSLLSFATDLTFTGKAKPYGPISLQEAASMIASSTTVAAVRSQLIDPRDADKTFIDLELALYKRFGVKAGNWQQINQPLTTGRLVSLLESILKKFLPQVQDDGAPVRLWQRVFVL